MSGYIPLSLLVPKEKYCRERGPVSTGGWSYHCFREPDHGGDHEAMAAKDEDPQMVTSSGTVKWHALT